MVFFACMVAPRVWEIPKDLKAKSLSLLGAEPVRGMHSLVTCPGLDREWHQSHK